MLATAQAILLCNYDCMLMIAVLVPIKTELKREEEAVIITKSEAVSAQPITGMSCHSITAVTCGDS